MLDRTDFASWKQYIRLYCRGKENGMNILKSIDEGPFQMGTFRETLAKEKDRYNADIRATNILLQGLPKDIYTIINQYTDAKDIWDNVKMLLEDKMLLMQAQENGVALDEELLLFIAGGQDNAVDEDVDEQPVQDLALNRKNLLIANDNSIADWLSKDVFYTATDYVLTVSRFSDMHEALYATQTRIVELKSKNSNMKNKIQNDNHDVTIKQFSKLEMEHLNLQLKYQHLKESFETKKSVTSSDAPTFDSLFVIRKLNDQVQSSGNTIRELREKISRLTKKHSDVDLIHDLKALDCQNKELHAKVNALHDLNKRWRAENKKVKRHYQELYDSIKIMRAHTIEKTNSLLTEVANLKAQLKENQKSNYVTMPSFKSKVLDPGRYVIDVEPIPLGNRNNRDVHLDYLKHLKESVATFTRL
nr:hypothetical protein [Tanacetum cinerariifolium]